MFLSPIDAFEINWAVSSAKRPPAGVRGGRRRGFLWPGHAAGQLAPWWRHQEAQPQTATPRFHPPSYGTLTAESSGWKRSPTPVMMRQWPLRAWATSRAPTFTMLMAGWWSKPWYKNDRYTFTLEGTRRHRLTYTRHAYTTQSHCFGGFRTDLICELVKWSLYCTLYVLYIIV